MQEEIGHGLRVRFDKREVEENRGGPGTGGLKVFFEKFSVAR